MEADFSGWATVHDLLCTDGRTISPEAFKHMDGKKVPLVWKHQTNDSDNILGHAVLEYRDKGIYAYGYFNETPKGKNAKTMVAHQDIDMLSIFANRLKEVRKNVQHGNITEVSLVPAGANPGAVIENFGIRHADDTFELLDEEAIIFTGLPLEHEDEPENSVEHADGEEVPEGSSVKDVIDTMSEAQKNAMYYVVEQALEKAGEPDPQDDAAHSDDENPDDTVNHSQEGNDMTRNLFEKNEDKTGAGAAQTLSHADVQTIVRHADKAKGRLSDSVNDLAESITLAHGINDIEVLFPDAKAIFDRPEFLKRRTEWVADVLGKVKHSPFSRIKTLFADITEDEARAKGYVKGAFKKEEFFSVSKRITTPTTVYKKQKLDRDDILDITDFDVVAWMKAEMRLMLEEEIARAILIGDGRAIDDEDKIKDPTGTVTEGAGIRSILNDHELYVTTYNVNVDDANSNQIEIADGILDAMQYYKGSGSPTLYTTLPQLTKMLLQRDNQQRRLWKTAGELASEIGVGNIVTVEVMESVTDLFGIIVNLNDYNVGADKGGEINFFDDFDIDFNQMKYLFETRISGALIKLKSAVLIKKTAAANVLVTPSAPTFVKSTGVVTIPTKTGVVYKNSDTNATLTAGPQTALAAGATLNVIAVPSAGYYLKDNASDEWDFTRPSA